MKKPSKKRKLSVVVVASAAIAFFLPGFCSADQIYLFRAADTYNEYYNIPAGMTNNSNSESFFTDDTHCRITDIAIYGRTGGVNIPEISVVITKGSSSSTPVCLFSNGDILNTTPAWGTSTYTRLYYPRSQNSTSTCILAANSRYYVNFYEGFCSGVACTTNSRQYASTTYAYPDNELRANGVLTAKKAYALNIVADNFPGCTSTPTKVAGVGPTICPIAIRLSRVIDHSGILIIILTSIIFLSLYATIRFPIQY